MIATELITILQDLISKHGDLQVFYEDSYYDEAIIVTVKPRYIDQETFAPNDLSGVFTSPRFVIV